MRKHLIALMCMVIGVTVTFIGTATPAQAASWSPQTCKTYGENGFKVCLRVLSSLSGGTRTAITAEACLYGVGVAGPSVQYAGHNRLRLGGSGGGFLGQEYFDDVNKGTCRQFSISPQVSGGNGMEAEWTGKTFASPGFDIWFSHCVKVATGATC